MKTIASFLTGLFCMLMIQASAQDAPITFAPKIYTAQASQLVSVPVTVTGFGDISGISLKFQYDPSVMSFQGYTPNSSLPGLIVNGLTTPGLVIISWYANYGVTLPDASSIVDISFTYHIGYTDITWYSPDEGSCEYAKYDNGAYTPLNDSPFEDFYKNGLVTGHYAPLTWAPTITDAYPGIVDIPIKVNRFHDIGAISLTFEYNPAVLSYQNFFVPNPVLSASGVWLIGTQDAPNGKKYMRISWTKNVAVPPLPAVNLPDSSTIVSLRFIYLTGSTPLIWYDDGGSCEYADGDYLPLEDTPTADYYYDGLVSGIHNAPVTIAPHVYNPLIGQAITVPITVRNFGDIGVLSLMLTYDPAVLTYQGFLPNAALTGFMVNGSTPGLLIMSWFATYGVTLPDNAHLVDLTFMNLGGTSALTWYSPEEGSCEYGKYNNGAYSPLLDAPFADYYLNGLVKSPSAPLTWAPIITNAQPGTVDVPIKVNGFNDIGAISLTCEYDPAVITYQNLYDANPVLSASGVWLIGTQDAPGGKKYMKISWTKNNAVPPLPPVNLPDSSTIVNLKFTYLSGTTPLTWYDDGGSCEYANGDYIPLDDIPTGDYYWDGLVTGDHYAPRTVAPCITGIVGQPVVFPVRVYGFSNIGAISLTLNYDPAVLTYQSTSAPGIPGSYAIDANGTGGTYIFGAMGGGGFSLPDGSVLFNITFIYNGGTCLLTWNDNGISCEYAEAGTFNPLWDTPREDYYEDGCVGPAPMINGKTYLEGPYSTSTQEMRTDLNSLSQLPLNQPYYATPWNYAGTESVTSFPAGTVDWVLVELRTSPLASSRIARRAGLLSFNGAITELDGLSPLAFPGVLPGYYYLVIWHRNHMAVMSATTVTVTPFTPVYDFSTGPTKIYGSSFGIKLIDPSLGRWGMNAADASNDQHIYINDFSDYWVPDFGIILGYSMGDFNMDGKVYIDDYTDLWVPNFGKTNTLP